jgi:putative ABC transport system permease protein
MFRQIAAVSAVSLRGLGQRLGASIVVVVGIAAVVGVLVSVFTMAGSLSGSLLASGRPDRALVIRSAAHSEGASTLARDTTAIVAAAPGVVRTPDGKRAVTSDVLVPVNLPRHRDGVLAGIAVRGMSAEGFAVRPEIRLVEGRRYRPGLRELLVGRNAQAEFSGLGIGDKVTLRDSEWTIVGVFTTGDATESGMLTDVDTLASAYQRGFLNSITARLESPGAFDEFKAALTTNPALSVDVFREPDYFAEQSKELTNLFFFVTYVVSTIMAAGALIGAVNTMYSAVSARAIEIATLRAIGFGGAAVAVSVVIEALSLASIGAAAGASIAWLVFNGDTISLGGTDASIVATFEIAPGTLATGFVWACGVGLLGAALPAVRAARLPVATALRAAR